MRYYVFHENKNWARILECESSFEARRICAAALQLPVTDFYAVRGNLMTSRDRLIYDTAENK